MFWFKKIFSALTRKERIIFICAAAGAIVSFIVSASIMIGQITVAVPTAGGRFTEGMVGQPQYLNPVIASTETDRDLVAMMYSPLTDLAQSITNSTDTKTWTVRLKENLTWQDGKKITSDDVAFTVGSIQNPDANSPLFGSWQGVAVHRVSELELQFTLGSPYAFFKDTLAGLYVLPGHIFGGTPVGNWRLSDYNLKPVGSGPYQFDSYEKNDNGFISAYTLQAWNGGQTKALIQNFAFNFFDSRSALIAAFNSGAIDGFGNASADELALIKRPYETSLWRTSGYYALFFNQSKNLALQDSHVRAALSEAIDRTSLIHTVFPLSGLSGRENSGENGTYGAVPDFGPVPMDAHYFTPIDATTSLDLASTTLDKAGWQLGPDGTRAKTIQKSVIPLSLHLVVPQIDFLMKTAEYLKNAWQPLGVSTTISFDSAENIASNTIKNRDYEALLFGNILGPSSDLFSFWDSSERFYPGLNLAIYDNPKADMLIAATRKNFDDAARAKQFAELEADIVNDYPAIFLYSPDYIYVSTKSLQGVSSGLLSDLSDRFRGVNTWYLNTARVLK